MPEQLEAHLVLAFLGSLPIIVFIGLWIQAAREKRKANPLQAKPTVYVDRAK